MRAYQRAKALLANGEPKRHYLDKLLDAEIPYRLDERRILVSDAAGSQGKLLTYVVVEDQVVASFTEPFTKTA